MRGDYGRDAVRTAAGTAGAGSATIRRMAFVPYALTRPFLFGLDPEHAHDLTLGAIAPLQNTPLQCLWQQPRVDDPVTRGRACASRTASAWPPGWTRTAAASTAWARWASASSRSAPSRRRRQPGNPKPRMFRLPEADALINRLGFNNEGLDAFLANVQRAHSFRARRRHPRPEHRQERRHADRARGRRLPARPGRRLPACRLRDGQHLQPEHARTCARCRATRRSTPCSARCRRAAASWRAQHGAQVPMFVKIAPDLDEAQVGVIAATLQTQRHRRRDRHQHDASRATRCRACRTPTRPAA